jgi:hypothetical protein
MANENPTYNCQILSWPDARSSGILFAYVVYDDLER